MQHPHSSTPLAACGDSCKALLLTKRTRLHGSLPPALLARAWWSMRLPQLLPRLVRLRSRRSPSVKHSSCLVMQQPCRIRFWPLQPSLSVGMGSVSWESGPTRLQLQWTQQVALLCSVHFAFVAPSLLSTHSLKTTRMPVFDAQHCSCQAWAGSPNCNPVCTRMLHLAAGYCTHPVL